MKIFLTGGSGFIGNAFRQKWSAKFELLAPTHRELDLRDANAVKDYLRENRFDVVLHTANTNDVVHRERAAYQFEYNLQMFCNLERCSSFFGKMLYFGSGAEYDMRHYLPQMQENYFGTHIPADPYGFSKYKMSQLAAKSRNIYDLRLFGVYGPGEEWRRRFISNMIYQALTGSEMRMDKNRLFDYLYIEDLISALERLLPVTPRCHHYNLCSGNVFSLRKLAQIIKEETGTCAQITMNSNEWNTEYTGNNARFTNEFGPLIITPMRDSIKQMISYYQKNGFR